MKTICIAGKNDIAVDILLYCKDKYPNNRLICITNRDESGMNTWQRSARWFAERNSVEILRLNDVCEIENMLFLSTEFDRIIRPEKFKTQELYNIHFSMLPKYKGCHTAVMPLLNGEDYTGVTLHKIGTGIDTGEIIEQKKIKIEDNDCSLDIYKKCLKSGTELIIKNFDKLISGDVEFYRQDSQKSTYYSRSAIDYSNLKLEVNTTAYCIQNQIRAFCFRPYQLLSWNGVKYVECKITDQVSNDRPGTIIEETDLFIKIATIDYNAMLFKDVFYELLDCIKSENNERAKELCLSHKMIEAQNEHGWSALTVAVYNNNFEMVKWLISKGADINIVNNNGTNLLMYAKSNYINSRDATIFEYLYNLGLSMERKDYYGVSLHDYCADEGISSIGDIQV